jgi:predicted transposase/invertase (TIGR01784 family)
MNRDDTLWKGILENVFDDFLRFFFTDADCLFDMKKGFRYLDKELEQLFPVENSDAPKFVDKLVKVYTKQGKEEWMLIHIEVQGYNDPHFARRMFTYFYRILDKYNKPVTAIAIFTGTNKKFHPAAYEYEYLGTKNSFQFNTYSIIDQEEEALANNDNPFATVLLTALLALKRKRLDDDSLFPLKYALAKNLLQKQFPKNKIDKLLIFLQLHVHFDNSAYNAKFDKAIEVLTNNRKTMGIREMVLDRAKKEGIEVGLEKGREEKTFKVVENLLAAGKFTLAEIANFADVSEAYIRKVKKDLK